MTGRSALGLVASLAAVLLSACTSGGGSTDETSAARTVSPAPTATVTTSRTVIVSPPPSSSSARSSASSVAPRPSAPSTPSGPSAPSAPSPCTNGDLRITASQGNGASQHNRYVLSFRNVSSSTCTLHGYPGLDGVNRDGTVLAHAKRTVSGFMGGSRHGIPTVRVAPGHVASATVEWATFDTAHPGGDCPYATQFLVTAANTTRAVTIHQDVALCGFQIHPTVAGGTGSST